MISTKIECRISYLNSLNGLGYLYYPNIPYDLAVVYDGKRVVVKPIIEVIPGNGFFNLKGKSYFLRDFTQNDDSHIPPDWALEWVNERINNKPYKVDLRLSDMDRFMLNGAIARRQRETANTLEKFGRGGSVDLS